MDFARLFFGPIPMTSPSSITPFDTKAKGEIIWLDQMVYGLPSFSHGTTRLVPTQDSFLFYSDDEGFTFDEIGEGFYGST